MGVLPVRRVLSGYHCFEGPVHLMACSMSSWMGDTVDMEEEHNPTTACSMRFG